MAIRYLAGTVTENGVGVARVVRAYRRDTGALLNQTTSAADGTFSMDSASYEGECTVIALAALDSPPAYNAVIFDGVIPEL